MSIARWFSLGAVASMMWVSPAALAETSNHIFHFAPQTGAIHASAPVARSHFRLGVDFGILNTANVGRKGVDFFQRVGAEYTFPTYSSDPRGAIHIDLYLGGLLDSNDAKVGLGNLIIGGEYRLVQLKGERETFSIHAGVATIILPTAQSEGFDDLNLAAGTPKFFNFLTSAFGLAPDIMMTYDHEEFFISGRVGPDVAIFYNNPGALDALELYLDAAFSSGVRLWGHWQVAFESVLISALTLPVRSTDIWIGPTISYQRRALGFQVGGLIPVNGVNSQAHDALISTQFTYNFN